MPIFFKYVTKDEAKHIREEFWTNFGKEYKRKWLLYDTRIKEIQLKFTFNTDVAQVSLDITATDEVIREYYWEKMLSLKNILLSDFLPDAEFEENYVLPEGKEISRIFTGVKGVNIYRKKDWPLIMEFLNDRMSILELFFLEYKDVIDS